MQNCNYKKSICISKNQTWSRKYRCKNLFCRGKTHWKCGNWWLHVKYSRVILRIWEGNHKNPYTKRKNTGGSSKSLGVFEHSIRLCEELADERIGNIWRWGKNNKIYLQYLPQLMNFYRGTFEAFNRCKYPTTFTFNEMNRNPEMSSLKS